MVTCIYDLRIQGMQNSHVTRFGTVFLKDQTIIVVACMTVSVALNFFVPSETLNLSAHFTGGIMAHSHSLSLIPEAAGVSVHQFSFTSECSHSAPARLRAAPPTELKV